MAFFAAINFASSQGVARVFLGVVLDYLTIAVVLAIIYMLFQLVTNGNGVGGLFGGGTDRQGGRDDDGSRKSGRKGKNSTDDGENNAPEDKSKDYPEWADGFGMVTVYVTDEDDNPVQGANVVVKHAKLPKMERKMYGYTGTNGTYGPKRIPAGQIMVKATHRNFFQYAITLAGSAALSASNPIIGGALLLGIPFLSTDRYVMKDWFILEKDKEEIFHVRLKRKKGQKDEAFRPFIVKVAHGVNKENQPAAERTLLDGEIQA